MEEVLVSISIFWAATLASDMLLSFAGCISSAEHVHIFACEFCADDDGSCERSATWHQNAPRVIRSSTVLVLLQMPPLSPMMLFYSNVHELSYILIFGILMSKTKCSIYQHSYRYTSWYQGAYYPFYWVPCAISRIYIFCHMQVVPAPAEILSYVTRSMFAIFQAEDGDERTGELEASKSVCMCHQERSRYIDHRETSLVGFTSVACEIDFW